MSFNAGEAVDVVDALHRSLGETRMKTTAEEIVAAGRTRRRRRRVTGLGVGLAAFATLGFAVNYAGPRTAQPTTATIDTVHVATVAFTLDRRSDGTVHLTWDKQRYFEQHAALEAALKEAGMPVVIRVGEFCVGPHDDTTLDPSGVGPGVEQVMKGESEADGKVVFVFTPSTLPAGKQLFIGYLDASQLAVTHGRPGSVERLVSLDEPLSCTTTPPPARS